MEVLPYAHLALAQRYQRLDEGAGGAIGAGSFGRVYQGWDALTQRVVCIKRQPMKSKSNSTLSTETAVYEMLRAFPHANVAHMLDRVFRI